MFFIVTSPEMSVCLPPINVIVWASTMKAISIYQTAHQMLLKTKLSERPGTVGIYVAGITATDVQSTIDSFDIDARPLSSESCLSSSGGLQLIRAANKITPRASSAISVAEHQPGKLEVSHDQQFQFAGRGSYQSLPGRTCDHPG